MNDSADTVSGLFWHFLLVSLLAVGGLLLTCALLGRRSPYAFLAGIFGVILTITIVGTAASLILTAGLGLIAWVPLVDCRATKSMYLLDRANSATVLAFHQRHPDDSHGLQQRLDDYSEFVEVRFGEALLFW